MVFEEKDFGRRRRIRKAAKVIVLADRDIMS